MTGEGKQSTTLSPTELADHYRSVHDYPWLDLEDDEYVVVDIHRTKVGKFFIWFCSVGITVVFGLVALIPFFTNMTRGMEILSIAFLFCAIASVVAGCILNWIYGRNYLIISNRRVFGRVQISPFSYKRQSIELGKIEDVSFNQNGILSMIFNYGMITMSTVGDEHTYKLTFVDGPNEQIKLVKKMVNGNHRPNTHSR